MQDRDSTEDREYRQPRQLPYNWIIFGMVIVVALAWGIAGHFSNWW